jgi:hypothetical protein
VEPLAARLPTADAVRQRAPIARPSSYPEYRRFLTATAARRPVRRFPAGRS